MLFYVLFGMLAAFGAVCAAWIAFGSLLCKGSVTAVCSRDSFSRGKWLRNLGLVDRVIIEEKSEEAL